MGQHAFSMDPRAILGVGPDASRDEIQDAYRAKSKKHHPDVGGDEWAFRMVARAYEVLKTTTDAPAASRPWERPAPTAPTGEPSPGWTWVGSAPFGGAGAASKTPENGFDDSAGFKAQPSAAPTEGDPASATPAGEDAPSADPDELRTVDVELIWTRFEFDSAASARARFAANEEDDATLSVCMVVSWPPHTLVENAARFSTAGDTLRTVIDRFERLRNQGAVVAARSRIEDGRFVGWLSYPDVLTAQDAVLTLRDTFKNRGLSVKLQTRDERVPFEGHGPVHSTVTARAS